MACNFDEQALRNGKIAGKLFSKIINTLNRLLQ